MTLRHLFLLAVTLTVCATANAAATRNLRILTWQDYVPADVAADFEKETGIHVEVTLSNNEDIITRLRASNGAGFDLAQPSHDRVAGRQGPPSCRCRFLRRGRRRPVPGSRP